MPTNAFDEYRRKLAAGEISPPVQRTPWQKLRDKPTLKAMLVAKCHECMGWGEGQERPEGVWTGIRGCTATGCPLHAARPYR